MTEAEVEHNSCGYWVNLPKNKHRGCTDVACCDAVGHCLYNSIEASSIFGLKDRQNPTRFAPIPANILIDSQSGRRSNDKTETCIGTFAPYTNGGTWVSAYGDFYGDSPFYNANGEYLNIDLKETELVEGVKL